MPLRPLATPPPFHREPLESLRGVVRRWWDELAGTDGCSEELRRDPRALLRSLGATGLLTWCGRAPFDPLAVAIVREELAHHSGLADALFAVQALGTLPLLHRAHPALAERWLPGLATGQLMAAFACTEPEAGSDLAAMATVAVPQGRGPDGTDEPGYALTGEKTFISNAGLADMYVVFARTGGKDPRRGLSAFVVPAESAGLWVEPLALGTDHPLGRLRFDGTFVPATHRLGAEGEGMTVAVAALTLMRPTVGAAACGFARRALDEALGQVTRRRQFGKPLAEQQSVRFSLAEMATQLDAARLLVFQAVTTDGSAAEAGLFGSMAKLFATEAAQEIVDRSLQLHGARGLLRGSVLEELYREVRALRIYEGTSEIQKLIIARDLLA